MFTRKNVVLTSRNKPDARSNVNRGLRAPQPTSNRDSPATAPASSSLIRPSLVDSVPCVSSGSRTLDKALANGGLPVGTLTLIEEHGTTDFSAAILKSAAAIQITNSRSAAARGKSFLKPKLICVGIPNWLRALPTVIDVTKSGVASSASTNTTTSTNSDERMRIAWRYAKYASAEPTDLPNLFCPNVDFKTTLIPAPQSHEVTYVLGSLPEIQQQLTEMLTKSSPNELVSIFIPSFLHPAVYPANSGQPDQMLPFIDSVKKMVRNHANAMAIASIPLQLFPRHRSAVAALELIVDTCVEIEPFDSVDEKVQGFLHINRISRLSDRGENVEQRKELSFRLGRHQFEVAPYAIPVEMAPEPEKEPVTSW